LPCSPAAFYASQSTANAVYQEANSLAMIFVILGTIIDYRALCISFFDKYLNTGNFGVELFQAKKEKVKNTKLA
jgi:hypothetical protein